MSNSPESAEAGEAVNAVNERMTEADLPPKLKNLWLKALSAVELRNFEYAISLLQAVLKEEPHFLEGRKVLRRSAIQKVKSEKKLIKFPSGGISAMKYQSQIKKDPHAALVAIEKDLEKDPYSIPINQALHEAAKACDLPDTASYAFEISLEGHPDNTKMAHALAEYYMEHESPDRSAEIYRNIVKRDPTDLAAVQGEKNASARASMKKQKWDSGDFRDLIKDKDQAKNLEQQSRAAMTPEQIDELLVDLGEKYAENPENLAVVKRIASLYEQREDWAAALQYYEWAYQISEKDSALERRVAQVKDKVLNQELNDMVVALDQETDPEVRKEKEGRIAELRKERAIQLIAESRERVERNPTDAQLRFELGQNLFDAGNFSDAIPELQRAKSNAYFRTRTMLMLGKCYEKKNMNDLAVRILKEAADELVAMDDTKKDVLYNLGQVYEKVGDKENWLESWKQIYEADYGYRDVARRVESSYTEEDGDAGASSS